MNLRKTPMVPKIVMEERSRSFALSSLLFIRKNPFKSIAVIIPYKVKWGQGELKKGTGTITFGT